MQILDDDTLAPFRLAGHCEFCGGYSCRLDPHHYWMTKGMGGGGQLDLRINLIALCFCCHRVKVPQGKTLTRVQCLKIVARREGVSEDAIKAALRDLRTLDKNTPDEVWKALLPRSTT